MENGTMRGWVTFVLAAAQIVVPLILFSGGFVQATPGLSAGPDYSAAKPAGYAFSIWTPIFALALFTAWQMLRPARARHLGLVALGWYPALTYGVGTLWMVAAVYGSGWMTVALIWAMLGFAFMALRRALTHRGDARFWRWGVVPGLGLFTGWLTAAVWVNTAGIGPDLGFPTLGLGAQGFGVVIIALATLMAAAMVPLLRATPAFVAALVWALVAIIVDAGIGAPVGIAASLAIVAIGAVSLSLARRDTVTG